MRFSGFFLGSPVRGYDNTSVILLLFLFVLF